MKTVLITGLIASGKSAVCSYLTQKGLPVYDCDSRCKSLYDTVPGLKTRVEEALGVPFSNLGVIFDDAQKRQTLEGIVYPVLIEDIRSWIGSQSSATVFVESAIALQKPIFNSFWDEVWLVRADESLRHTRNAEASRRSKSQCEVDPERATVIIENNSDIESLHKQIDKILISMKTDLAKILSVSGQHGLYEYIAQARNGIIAEALCDKKRTSFDAHSRITTLADISIYTSEGEMKLAEVFKAMKDASASNTVPTSKSDSDAIKAFFEAALPTYDRDRFYVSHMKKVLDWYSDIDQFASFDFVTDEERGQEVEND